jgi:hypothetical protein
MRTGNEPESALIDLATPPTGKKLKTEAVTPIMQVP